MAQTLFWSSVFFQVLLASPVEVCPKAGMPWQARQLSLLTRSKNATEIVSHLVSSTSIMCCNAMPCYAMLLCVSSIELSQAAHCLALGPRCPTSTANRNSQRRRQRPRCNRFCWEGRAECRENGEVPFEQLPQRNSLNSNQGKCEISCLTDKPLTKFLVASPCWSLSCMGLAWYFLVKNG